MRIGFLGAGRIANRVAVALASDGHEIAFALSRSGSNLTALPDVPSVETVDAAPLVDLVIEAASPQALSAHARAIVARCDLAVISTTGLVDDSLRDDLGALQARHGTRMTLTPGGIVGLDTLSHVRDLITSVEIRTIKPPAMWGLEPHDLKNTIFEGTTREACVAYPRNVNVHANVALASIGFDRCRSLLISDPAAKAATQHIAVEGPDFGWTIDLHSAPIGGVTGSLTPASMLGAVRKLLSDMVRL